MLVAVRFLGVAEFGYYALASAAVLGLIYLGEAGWRERIVMAATDYDVAQAHGAAILGGVVLAATGAGLGFWASQQEFEPLAFQLVSILSVGVALASFSAAQAGLLVRRRKAVTLAAITVTSEGAGLAAGIAAFVAGWGVYALAASRLTALGVAAVCSLGATRYLTLGNVFSPGGGAAFAFSLRILATRLLSFAEQNGGLFLIGFFVGPTTAGLYRAGARLAAAIGEAIGETARYLAWTKLVGRQANLAPTGAVGEETHMAFIKLLLAVYAPLYVGLALVSGEMVRLLLGPEWAPAAQISAALAIRQLLLSPKVVSEPLLAARRDIKWLPRLGFASLAITIVFTSATAPFGLTAIAWGQIGAALCIVPLLIWVQQTVAGVRWAAVALRLVPVAVAASALAAAVLVVGLVLPQWPTLLLFAAKVIAGFIAYAAALLVLDFRWTVTTVKNIV